MLLLLLLLSPLSASFVCSRLCRCRSRCRYCRCSWEAGELLETLAQSREQVVEILRCSWRTRGSVLLGRRGVAHGGPTACLPVGLSRGLLVGYCCWSCGHVMVRGERDAQKERGAQGAVRHTYYMQHPPARSLLFFVCTLAPRFPLTHDIQSVVSGLRVGSLEHRNASTHERAL